jgi:hypothetical protein
VHFPNIIGEEFSITLSQHFASRDDGLPMSLIAAGKLNPLSVGQFFAVVNIEEVAGHAERLPEIGSPRHNVS